MPGVCFPIIAYLNAVLRSSGLVVVSVLFVPCVKPLPGAGTVGKTPGRRGFMRANMKNAVGKFDALQYMIVCFNILRFGRRYIFTPSGEIRGYGPRVRIDPHPLPVSERTIGACEARRNTCRFVAI